MTSRLPTQAPAAFRLTRGGARLSEPEGITMELNVPLFAGMGKWHGESIAGRCVTGASVMAVACQTQAAQWEWPRKLPADSCR